MSKNLKVSLLLNILIIISSSLGFILNTNFGVEFYTRDSNFLAIIASLIYVVYAILKKDEFVMPVYTKKLRYISTVTLTLTFLVVIFILVPTSTSFNEGINKLILKPEMLFQHIVSPILSLVSFMFFEGDRRLNKKKTIWLTLLPTVVYGLVLITLNLLSKISGPYPFLKINEQKWYISLMWFVIIFIGNYLIARYILLINQIRAPRIKK